MLLSFWREGKSDVEKELVGLQRRGKFSSKEEVVFITDALDNEVQRGRKEVRDWLLNNKVYDAEECALAFSLSKQITSGYIFDQLMLSNASGPL